MRLDLDQLKKQILQIRIKRVLTVFYRSPEKALNFTFKAHKKSGVYRK